MHKGVIIMNSYDFLLSEADDLNIITKEKNLYSSDGRIKGNKIAIRKGLTTTEKVCTLAEELGHYHLTVGNILDQTNLNNSKQEHVARMWSYNKLIGLQGFIDAFEHHCINLYETAEYLGVTEEFLIETINAYMHKYGSYIKHKEYIIEFNFNSVGVIKKI